MRYFVILNPAAGKGSGAEAHQALQQTLDGLKLDYTLALTGGPGDAIKLAQQAAADGYDVVAAAGGDGTLNEALNGLMRARQAGEGKACLAVLPVGRGNDFAFGLGAPTHWEEGCRALVANRRRVMDVGWVAGGDYPEGRYVGNGVGIGFDTVVGFVAAKTRLRGMMAYLYSALKTLALYFRAPRLRIKLDDQEIVQETLMLSIMNGKRMGGTFLMAPESKQDDGLFDLCHVGKLSRLGALGLIPRFFNGGQYGHPAVHHYRSRTLEIEALEGSLPVHADGETICEAGKSLRLEMLPAQIELIIRAEETA